MSSSSSSLSAAAMWLPSPSATVEGVVGLTSTGVMEHFFDEWVWVSFVSHNAHMHTEYVIIGVSHHPTDDVKHSLGHGLKNAATHQ